MSQLIKPAMFYTISRILVWFSEQMSALQVCHDMTKFSISDWPCKKDTTWEFVKIQFLLSEYWLSFSLCNLLFLCEKNQYLLLYSTINHTKACFKNYTRSMGQGIQPFLVIVAFLMAVAVCLLPFTTAGGVRCSLHFSFWLEPGWMWASNIYVHGIHSLRSILVG